MTAISISIRNASKSFGSTRAVRNLNLDVPTGSLCGFLGPNGAGKSTTIRMIMSIIYPDPGHIEVLGGSALQSKDRIGYLPEERGLYRKMRVSEFLSYLARLKGVKSPSLNKHIGTWLERVQLPDVGRKRCEELSKGMQQKVQFLAAVIHEPELLILDEPFSGLDPVNTELIRELIDDLHRQGTTIIFSTHILHQAEQICDRIFLINHGIKLLDSTLAQIREQFDPRTVLVEPMNGSLHLDQIAGVSAARRLRDTPCTELELERDVDPHAVMQAVISQGPVRSVALRRLTLDEVFVRLVREGEGTEAANRVREELSHV
jgi:ABC-2 type transport system ATP-binding protein